MRDINSQIAALEEENVVYDTMACNLCGQDQYVGGMTSGSKPMPDEVYNELAWDDPRKHEPDCPFILAKAATPETRALALAAAAEAVLADLECDHRGSHAGACSDCMNTGLAVSCQQELEVAQACMVILQHVRPVEDGGTDD